MTEADCNISSNLGQAQNCGRVNPVNWIPTFVYFNGHQIYCQLKIGLKDEERP